MSKRPSSPLESSPGSGKRARGASPSPPPGRHASNPLLEEEDEFDANLRRVSDRPLLVRELEEMEGSTSGVQAPVAAAPAAAAGPATLGGQPEVAPPAASAPAAAAPVGSSSTQKRRKKKTPASPPANPPPPDYKDVTAENFREKAAGSLFGLTKFGKSPKASSGLVAPISSPEPASGSEDRGFAPKAHHTIQGGEEWFGQFVAVTTFESEAMGDRKIIRLNTRDPDFEFEPSTTSKKMFGGLRMDDVHDGQLHINPEDAEKKVRMSAVEKAMRWRRKLSAEERKAPRRYILLEHSPQVSVAEAGRWTDKYTSAEFRTLLSLANHVTVVVDVNNHPVMADGGCLGFFAVLEGLVVKYSGRFQVAIGEYGFRGMTPEMFPQQVPLPTDRGDLKPEQRERLQREKSEELNRIRRANFRKIHRFALKMLGEDYSEFAEVITID